MAQNTKKLPSLEEVPLYKEEWGRLRNFLIDVKRNVEKLVGDPAIPGQIASFAVTTRPLIGGIEIVWEPVRNAQSYRIYRNTTRDLSTAIVVAEIFGNMTKRFVDGVLTSGTYYYWISTVNSQGFEGVPFDLTGTTGTSSVSQLSDITSNLGHITAGDIVLPSGGFIRSGQTAYDTGTGFWLGNDSGTPKFSIGNSGGDKLTWDGSTLAITGNITAADITGSVITGSSFQTAGSGNNRVTIDDTNGLQLIDSSNVTLVQMLASSYAGILVSGLRAIDSGDIFLESNNQHCQLFVSDANNKVSFVTASVQRGYFDNQDGSGAGNQPTSLAIRVNGSVQRVNRDGTTGYLYI